MTYARTILVLMAGALVVGCSGDDDDVGSGGGIDGGAIPTGGTGGADAGSGGTGGGLPDAAGPNTGGAGGVVPEDAGIPQSCGNRLAEERLVADSVSGVFQKDLTVEMWFRLDEYTDYVFEPLLSAVGPAVDTSIPDMPIYPAFRVGNIWETIGCDIGVVETAEVSSATVPMGPALLGGWHHLACTRDDQRLTLWLDGTARAFTPQPWAFTDAEGLQLGATVEHLGFFPPKGEVAEVHVAASVLYTGDFTPPVRIESVASSTLLWHLDDCSASTVSDAAGGDNPGHWQPQ